MALTHISLDRITEDDLQALINAGAAESVSIEYKRDTYGGNDDARAEFLADVSSLANARGGDLIVGMEATAGVPTALVPFTGNVDAEKLRFEQMARSGLEPRIHGLQIGVVPIASGGAVLIVRSPRSYSAPHRVIFKGKNRFWARSSAGKYEPNVDELRAMFTLAPQLAERMREFRMQRIARIVAGDIGVRPMHKSCLVLHVVPFSSFDIGASFPIEEATKHVNYFPPMGAGYAQDYRFNFDGCMLLSNATEGATEQRAYVQVFRSGAIEALDARGDTGNLDVRHIDATIVKHARVYAMALKECGAAPPYAVMPSLIGIKGRGLAYSDDQRRSARIPAPLQEQDQLHFAEAIFEEVPTGNQDCATALRGALDQLWDAANRPRAESFDAEGVYQYKNI